MKIIVTKDNIEGGTKAFEIIKNGMANGAKVLGLATGSSPISLYSDMCNSDLDFSEMTSINLDEYYGISPENPQSYHYFMQKHLFDQKPFKKSYIPNGLAKNIDEEVENYNQIIQENPIDIQILGIGHNGHIAFNEPGTPFGSLTHKVTLAESTIKANSRFFNNEKEVPRQAICMGIRSIMQGKKIVLLAYGASKQDALKALVEGPVIEKVPASILQDHPDVTIICDQIAAKKINPKYFTI
ncbi:glucosamine-6-phosphate deaminase [Lactobacillus sp. PV037]|uniref:glucosamine-6-phosphate deaminase n=1 Tax=Lactobacillus sp. PV037 TaxID=2594496 RepID=UPI00223F653C|nr:glucosamine-6-phosphate deaminase [Lactobacillus sp. PV037]QNQ84473.1 glucosamine-6-phosphate deaminase [Lactobacillus sp. PV037]